MARVCKMDISARRGHRIARLSYQNDGNLTANSIFSLLRRTQLLGATRARVSRNTLQAQQQTTMACRTTHTETVNSPVSGLAHDGRSPKAQVARVRDPSACKNEELVRTSGPCEAEELETTTSAKRLKVMWQMMTQGLQGLSQGLDLVAAVYTCSVASAILVGDGLCSGLVGGACAVVMLGGCAALGLSPMNRIVDVVAPLYTAGAVIAFSTAATGGGSRSLPDEMPIVNERHSDGRPNFTGTWRMVSCASRIRAAPVAYVNCIR